MKDNKFKIGDWVKNNSVNTKYQIQDIFKNGYSWYATSIKLEPRNKWDSYLYGLPELLNDCVLWKPKEGEWCWFWNEGASEPSLGQFKEEIMGKYYVKRKIYAFDFCEPFIGKLPSFLKENK